MYSVRTWHGPEQNFMAPVALEVTKDTRIRVKYVLARIATSRHGFEMRGAERLEMSRPGRGGGLAKARFSHYQDG